MAGRKVSDVCDPGMLGIYYLRTNLCRAHLMLVGEAQLCFTIVVK